MEPKPGSETSEFTLAKMVLVAGVVVDVAAIALAALQDSGAHWGWLPGAMLVVGMLTKLFGALGYTRSRTMVKVAALQPQASEVLRVSVPFVKEVASLVREELKRPPPGDSLPTPPERPSAMSPPASAP